MATIAYALLDYADYYGPDLIGYRRTREEAEGFRHYLAERAAGDDLKSFDYSLTIIQIEPVEVP